MTKDDFFKIVRPGRFFPKYAPGVKRFYHKIRGVDTHGKELAFSFEDKKAIDQGIDKLFKEIKSVKF